MNLARTKQTWRKATGGVPYSDHSSRMQSTSRTTKKRSGAGAGALPLVAAGPFDIKAFKESNKKNKYQLGDALDWSLNAEGNEIVVVLHKIRKY